MNPNNYNVVIYFLNTHLPPRRQMFTSACQIPVHFKRSPSLIMKIISNFYIQSATWYTVSLTYPGCSADYSSRSAKNLCFFRCFLSLCVK